MAQTLFLTTFDSPEQNARGSFLTVHHGILRNFTILEDLLLSCAILPAPSLPTRITKGA